MSSNALLWPSQGTKPEERLDKYKYLKIPSQGFGGGDNRSQFVVTYPPIANQQEDRIVFNDNELDVSPEDTSPFGVTISSDGLTLLIVGAASDKIFQYNLTIANDINTATFSGNELDVTPQDLAPRGVTISSDGLTLFIIGTVNNKIFQYNLTTPNDINTATFSGNELDVSPEDTSPFDLTVSSDGLKIFIVGPVNDTIFQYNLTIANDLSTATFSGNDLDVSTEDTSPLGLTISSDGLALFIVGATNDKIFQYDLTIANDLSTAVFSGIELDVSPEDTSPFGVTISSDGLTLFIIGATNDKIFQYDLTTPNDLSTAKFFSNDLDISPQEIFPQGLTISSDGLKIFMTGAATDKIFQYNLTTPNDINTAVFSGNELDISPQDSNPEGLTISSDGLTLFMIGAQNDKIFQYDLTIANDLSTAVFSGIDLDVSPEAAAPFGLTISSDGLTIFIVGAQNNKIFQYDLTTPNDLSTAVFSGNELDVSPEAAAPFGLTISSDGLKIFMVGVINNKIYQYNLTIANDLSTAVFSGIELDVSPQDSTPLGVTVSSNGLKIFMVGTANDKIFQYDLLTIINIFQFYQFHQINRNQIPSLQLNITLEIAETLGPGILQQASGFDIRVFDTAGLPLFYDIVLSNPVTGEIIVRINMAQAQDFEFVQLTFGNPIATDGSTPSEVLGPPLNNDDAFWFITPLLEDEPHFLVDDQGRNIVAVES